MTCEAKKKKRELIIYLFYKYNHIIYNVNFCEIPYYFENKYYKDNSIITYT